MQCTQHSAYCKRSSHYLPSKDWEIGLAGLEPNRGGKRQRQETPLSHVDCQLHTDTYRTTNGACRSIYSSAALPFCFSSSSAWSYRRSRYCCLDHCGRIQPDGGAEVSLGGRRRHTQLQCCPILHSSRWGHGHGGTEEGPLPREPRGALSPHVQIRRSVRAPKPFTIQSHCDVPRSTAQAWCRCRSSARRERTPSACPL